MEFNLLIPTPEASTLHPQNGDPAPGSESEL